MQKYFLSLLICCISIGAFAQSSYPEHQLSVNGFRNPSIGMEYHYSQISVHVGYYITAFKAGVTTKFLKVGISYWVLPFGKKEIPHSIYVGTSYMRGINLDYKNKNAFAFETGARFTVWKVLQFRAGVIGVATKDRNFKINPTPSINYTFKL